jgi:Leucine-rich repeat (LRR) protein
MNFFGNESFDIIGDHLSGFNDDNVQSILSADSTFDVFPMELFDKFKNLVEIDFDQRNVRHLSVPFRNCEKLRVIKMRGNKIEKLSKVFDNCADLVLMFFERNQILTIEAGILENQGNLQMFYVYNNKFQNLPEDIFKNTLNLLYFYAGNNQITEITKNHFNHLKKVTHIWLDRNNLTTIVDALDALDGFQSSDIDFFSNCFVNYLHCNFKRVENRFACELAGASVMIDMETLMIDNDVALNAVTYIFATDSIIEFIPQELFDDFNQLQELDLQGVQMKELRILENCNDLTVLRLQENFIETLPEKAFKSCQYLQEI